MSLGPHMHLLSKVLITVFSICFPRGLPPLLHRESWGLVSESPFIYSSYLAPCLAPGRDSLSNEWKWKKKECKFLETWSSDNSVETDDYINSLWSWVSNRGQNLGNLGPQTEVICSWTLRVHIVNGVPFLHCWGLGQSCRLSQQNRLVGVYTVGELSWQ